MKGGRVTTAIHVRPTVYRVAVARFTTGPVPWRTVPARSRRP